MPGRLGGKVAIVTGGGSGIGRAAAIRFAGEGACVLVADIAADGAGAVAGEISGGGGMCHVQMPRGVPVAMSPSVTPMLTPEAIIRMVDAGVKAVSLSLDGATAATHDGVICSVSSRKKRAY